MRRLSFVLLFLLITSIVRADSITSGYDRTKVDTLEFKGIPAPSLAPSGKGRIYYKQSDNKFYCSKNGGAYAECLTSSTSSPTDATYITQTADSTLSAEQALGSLATGLLKNTTTTGVLSIGASGTDYAPATSGTSILKGSGSGGFSSASAGTDYQGVVTGGATTILSSNLTASDALISNADGKVAVKSSVSSTELGYVDGVTSAIQTQIDAKATGTITTGTARAIPYYAAASTTIAPSSSIFTDNTSVGIATSTPRTKLEVAGTITVTSGGSNAGRIGIGTTAPRTRLEVTGTISLMSGGSSAGSIGIGTSAPRTRLETQGTISVIHGGDNGGRIGIGNTAPGGSLDITATGSSTAALAVKVGTNALTVTNSGIVGVGTSAPSGSGKMVVVGGADVVQLYVQGNGTQTSNLVSFVNSSATNELSLSNAGLLTTGGAITTGGSTTTQNTLAAGIVTNSSNNSSANGGDVKMNGPASQYIKYIADSNHIHSSGTIPTVASCGSGPSVTTKSTDMAGSVTIGTAAQTSCVITFIYTWANAPFCTVTDASNVLAVKGASSTTTLTLTSLTSMSSDVITWHCIGGE